MRTFLAVTLDSKVKEELRQIQENLQGRIKGFRWINPELLHITLKFLGETDEGLVARMKNPLRELAEKTSAFTVSLVGLGAFPSLKEPRVIWIGIDEGRRELSNLYRGVEEILLTLHLSFSPEKTPKQNFHPHLTIGRRNKKEAFEAEQSLFKESWEVKNRLYIESFSLIKSILRPSGPLYVPLQEFLLKKM